MRSLLLPLVLLAGAASAQDRAAVERDFRAWLEGTVWPGAAAGGVSRATFEAALGGVAPLWDLSGLRPPGAPREARQAQAEFRAPQAYFDPEGVAAAVALAREMAEAHADTLADVERATGVPGPMLLAIWGRESAFGRAALPYDAFAVLATRGFMGERADLFAAELLAALRVAEEGLVTPASMRSSAAGALGQPQFLPSSVLDHAADGDGDGIADIWASEADALASIGAFLRNHGWVAGLPWGLEVTAPSEVSCALEGPDRARPGADWAALGVTARGPLPEGALFLVMPAGRHGPAFLATANFLVLKDYNTSDLYALWVGEVADRIAGGMGTEAPWEDVEAPARAEVARAQRRLMAEGLDTGGDDGLPGFRTRRAIGAWQEARGLAPTCWPDPATLAALLP